MATHPLLRFKKFHYYLVPLIALTVWWGMLIAMLSSWSIQGHPIYAFMGNSEQDPVYISDIGATNLKPLFISCAGFQAIFFVGTLIMDYYLRVHQKLQPYVSLKQPTFAIISIICAVIGQLGILFVAIFDTNNFHKVHLSMVGVFIAFCFFACFFNFLNSFIFGNYPQRLTPNHEKVIFGKHRWSNLYMVSFWLKCIWLLCAATFALLFGIFMKSDRKSLSASFEWTISFWYGLLLVMWSIDLFPSAVKHYKVRHPEENNNFANSPDNEKEEQRTVSTFGAPTYINPTEQTENFVNGVNSSSRQEQEPRQSTLSIPIPSQSHQSLRLTNTQNNVIATTINDTINAGIPINDTSPVPSPTINRHSQYSNKLSPSIN